MTGTPLGILSLIDPFIACRERALQGTMAEIIISEYSANRVDMGPQCGGRPCQVVMGSGCCSGERGWIRDAIAGRRLSVRRRCGGRFESETYRFRSGSPPGTEIVSTITVS